jgi:formate hydrogenlyase transcriptional activator
MGRRIESIPVDIMEALLAYQWPGNIRELQNVIERAVILSRGTTLHVPLTDLQSQPTAAALTECAGMPERSAATLADAEREHILTALRETNWVMGGPKGAANRLGMKRSTLQHKMKKLGISRSE